MANPDQHRIIQLGNNKATLDGYDMPDAEIVARSEKYDHKKIIVLKIPGTQIPIWLLINRNSFLRTCGVLCF